VARAVVLEPEVLLFDEPLSNLDAKLRRRVREEIRELQQRLGLTAVYVTHDQEEALAISDMIVVMNNAVIAQVGQPRELYEAPADRFVADFIGDANVVEVTITSTNGEMAEVIIGNAKRHLPHRGLNPGPAHLAIRPEGIVLAADPAEAAIGGRIKRASYLGSHVEYDIETPLGELFVTDPDVNHIHTVGQDISLDLGTHGVTLVRD
jgi:iron(III) transport system ATP-binding protein